MTDYALDPGRSRLSFRAKSFRLFWVTGTFDATSGTLQVVDGVAEAGGTAATASVSTGIKARDWHLRHHHYLDAARHPTISLAIPATPVEVGATAVATVSARGKSANVTLKLERWTEAPDGELEARLSGTLDRTQLGMLPPLAGVSRQVELTLDLVARDEGQ